MANRYRMYPAPETERVMREVHCAHSRYVWNLCVEQQAWWRPGRGPAPSAAARQRQLAQARQAEPWLREGSSSVQQQALRDYDTALAAFFDPKNPARKPSFRSKKKTQGFVIRDVKTRRVNRHWGEVHVPKCGWVRFRWSRPLPDKPGMARVTLDRAGRWHVAFPAAQPSVQRVPDPVPAVGIDRGVRTALVTSGGQHYRAPRISGRDAERYLALQRKLARQKPGSNRREKTRRKMAVITAKVTGRRKDWAEKISTRLVAGNDLIVFEKLPLPNMVRKPAPKPDPDKPGAYLPNQARAKAGLNRGILASAWGTLGTRTRQKAEASGVTVLFVDPRFTSQQCHACGHVAPENRESQAVFTCVACGHADHADANAARNILARGLALISDETVPAHDPGQGNKRPRKTAQAEADTTRNAA
jgi:putative transposase